MENSDSWAYLIPTESESQKGGVILLIYMYFFNFYVTEPELRNMAQNHAVIRY